MVSHTSRVTSSRISFNKVNRTAGRHVPNAILKAETVHDIFVPVLPARGVQSLSEFIRSEGTSWSTALAVSTKEVTGRRRKGVTFCKFKFFLMPYYLNSLFFI